MAKNDIRTIDLSTADLSLYTRQFADCVILTHDNRLYMQKRPDNWHRLPGVICNFGGHIEEGETPLQALVREVCEETGGQIKPGEPVFIDAITEGRTNHTELVHVYFWHDRNSTITGCYEAEFIHFTTPEEALAHPQVMDYARWALEECLKRDLVRCKDST